MSSTVSPESALRDNAQFLDERVLHGFGGVVDQVDDNAFELLGVDQDRGQTRCQASWTRMPSSRPWKTARASAHNVVQVAANGLRGGKAGELREFVHQRLDRLHFFGDDCGAFRDDAPDFGRRGERGRAAGRCARPKERWGSTDCGSRARCGGRLRARRRPSGRAAGRWCLPEQSRTPRSASLRARKR